MNPASGKAPCPLRTICQPLAPAADIYPNSAVPPSPCFRPRRIASESRVFLKPLSMAQPLRFGKILEFRHPPVFSLPKTTAANIRTNLVFTAQYEWFYGFSSALPQHRQILFRHPPQIMFPPHPLPHR